MTPHYTDAQIAAALPLLLPRYAAMLRQVMEERDKLRDELAEARRLFDLQQKRMAEAVAEWRMMNPGNDLVQPDLGALLHWLMEERKAAIRDADDRLIELSQALNERDEAQRWRDEWREQSKRMATAADAAERELDEAEEGKS